MTAEILNLFHFIKNELLVGFGVYTLLHFIVKKWSKSLKLPTGFDTAAIDVAFFLGILTSLVSFFSVVSFSPFLISLLVQPLIWLVLTLCLKFTFLQHSTLYRLFFSLSFVLTLEVIIIILTSIHRDYASEFNLHLDKPLHFFHLALSWTIKCLEFVLITLLYYGIKRKLKLSTSSPAQS